MPKDLRIFSLPVLALLGLLLLPPEGASASAGCRLPGPRIVVSLPDGVPPWTLGELRRIAAMALAEDAVNALWRWENLMAGPDFRDLGGEEVGQLSGVIQALTRIGLEARFGGVSDRLSHFSSVRRQIAEARRETTLALARLNRGRPGSPEPVFLAVVLGFPRTVTPGVEPVLIRQERLLDRRQLEAHRASLDDLLRSANGYLAIARLDGRNGEERLAEVLDVIGRLDSSLRWAVLKATTETP